MTPVPGWAVPALLSAALLTWSPASAITARRSRAIAGRSPDRAGSHPLRRLEGLVRAGPVALRRRALSAVGGVAVGALLGGGLLGAGAAVGAALALDRALRGVDPGPHRERALALERDLPEVCELLAVCLAAGVPVAGALAAVAGATAEPLAGELRTVAALHRLGAPPARAWAEACPELGQLGRIVVRAEESGASVGPALRALAVDRRAAARARTESAIRRAGVWVLAPLAGCFLPAFVCLGVAPLVLGIAGHVFS